jgi:hypothetical protein
MNLIRQQVAFNAAALLLPGKVVKDLSQHLP